MEIPVIAIVGRPNVGKSTLFNCFSGGKKAIVSDIPGTTRDSLMERIEGENFIYWFVDTAGLTNSFGDDLEKEIQMQAELAAKNADLVIFLVDGRKEMTRDDEEIAAKLRKSHSPVILTANKIDDGNEAKVLELTRWGLGVPLAISAKNYVGMWELEDKIDEALRKKGFPEKSALPPSPEKEKLKIAFVGRPNVGKSSMVNTLLGKNRSLVSPIPNTTRDTIDTEFTWEGKNQGEEIKQEFLFLDTAGLRRSGRIGKDLDFWSSVRTVKAIERSDVCALIIDALDGVTHQDAVIAGQILEAGKGMIVIVNKFDLVREKSHTEKETDERELVEIKMWDEDIDTVKKKYLSYLERKLPFSPSSPVIFCSAKTNRGTKDIFASALGIAEERKKRIPTSELNRFLPEIIFGHVTPSKGIKVGKIKFVEQVEVSPPKFLFFVHHVGAFHFSYRRYVENKLREKYGFQGTPMIVEFREAS